MRSHEPFQTSRRAFEHSSPFERSFLHVPNKFPHAGHAHYNTRRSSKLFPTMPTKREQVPLIVSILFQTTWEQRSTVHAKERTEKGLIYISSIIINCFNGMTFRLNDYCFWLNKIIRCWSRQDFCASLAFRAAWTRGDNKKNSENSLVGCFGFKRLS